MNLSNMPENALKWPFPVDYEKVNYFDADVLVIGAGAAGSSAAIAAAERGAKVIICEKGASVRAGNCGAGIDHWTDVSDAPGSLTSDEKLAAGKLNGNARFIGVKGPAQVNRDYIACKGTWKSLLRLEEFGLPVRDEDGDFETSPTRDSESGHLKAYNYNAVEAIKLRGGNFLIPVLNKKMRSLGVTVLDRVMITTLFNEDGKQGSKITGAAGFSTETGEFYVFNVKAVILASGYVCGNWISSTEITGSSYRWDPNDTGDGQTMAYLAGAKMHSFWSNGAAGMSHPFAWPRFGVGSSGNTWAACTIVDNNGKEVPWVYSDGSKADSYWERVCDDGKGIPHMQGKLMEAVKNGEYEMPFWADLSSIPERERRSIWGMMVGNEGKTRFTLYDYYTRSGFNPEKHMLMCPIDAKTGAGHMHGENGAVRPWRSERGGQGEVFLDWDLQTSVPGLFAAGAAAGLEGSSFACSSGDYAGGRAYEYAAKRELSPISESLIENERNRVYAPVKRSGNPEACISWKELWNGTARVMQQCCGDYISKSTLELGIRWMESIKNNEGLMTWADNPHELARVMECENRFSSGLLFMNSCLEMLKATEKNPELIAKQTEGETPYLNKFLLIHQEDGKICTEIKEADYYLKGDNLPTCSENYTMHAGKETE